MGPPGVLLSSTNDMIVTPTRSTTLCSTRRSKYSVTPFLSPAHEFFYSRKLRLAPQDYSPWTPRTDRFLVRSYPPASRHELEQPGRSTRWNLSGIPYLRVLDLVGSTLDEHGGDGKSPGHA